MSRKQRSRQKQALTARCARVDGDARHPELRADLATADRALATDTRPRLARKGTEAK